MNGVYIIGQKYNNSVKQNVFWQQKNPTRENGILMKFCL